MKHICRCLLVVVVVPSIVLALTFRNYIDADEGHAAVFQMRMRSSSITLVVTMLNYIGVDEVYEEHLSLYFSWPCTMISIKLVVTVVAHYCDITVH